LPIPVERSIMIIELYCDERPPIHEGQVLMVRSLDPHGE
jgi:hypothetical protein